MLSQAACHRSFSSFSFPALVLRLKLQLVTAAGAGLDSAHTRHTRNARNNPLPGIQLFEFSRVRLWDRVFPDACTEETVTSTWRATNQYSFLMAMFWK